ncbi:hypothetical protein BKH42_00510 [Helicobacter sp. 13S00482-2]|uniref:methylenetetrahydrofolate reductase n=1 Tax=Helicobacter sp. 13S00482-2 TaxID=1476200 RepID=UPI000BA612E5|nr:methylenetetrahydrofolate reductase [Helicobacter sp. 13S00482-2]PAF54430.1 hypothetical protein BKH42_00510 [Helicobacter sp. 13S00482-2]
MIGLEYIPKQKEMDLELISNWIDKIKPDFILIPDSPNSRPTPESCIISMLWKQRLAIDVIGTIAGSGRRKDRIESTLLALKYLQVNKVALIGGDSPSIGDLNGIELIKKAKDILGEDSVIISGSKAILDTEEKHKLKTKIEAGANIIISQPIFEPKIAQKFLDDFETIAKGSNAMGMISFFPIYESAFCKKIINNNLGFEIPQAYIDEIKNNPIKTNIKLYEELCSIGADIHISGGKNSFLQEFFDNFKS